MQSLAGTRIGNVELSLYLLTNLLKSMLKDGDMDYNRLYTIKRIVSQNSHENTERNMIWLDKQLEAARP